eukprot:TRINITY_DN2959_c0_g1_i1.p1 TRINITY_DN2959_c0_g1~~TRINITY_DN2959_c0_g1_i1.p1  ORF type:complete len:656 (+),score=236.54 TRINITY_DN2959_c0_g1_i1:67-2034(+)
MVAIGIDLGTTYSCVGVMNNGRVEILTNDQGRRTTPSYVAFTKRERLIGEAAKRQAARNPKNTVFDAKRLIGRRFSDRTVQEDMKHWHFDVIQGDNDRPMIEVNFQGEKKRYYAEQISAMVLEKMVSIAEAYLGTEVKDAVVTVPAYFNDSQRNSTKDAGRIAGLNVLRVLNEPTAAAIAYGLNNNTEVERNVLIFDLGGGTFDVSLLAIEGDFFNVIATNGDTHLGGEDFDSRIVKYLVEEFKKQHPGLNIESSDRALRRLRNEAERAKIVLSSSAQTTIEIEALFEGEDFECQLTRARFEQLNMDLFRSCMKPVENVLRDADLDKNEIHEVVLVGGSTRIPKIQELIKEFFNGKEPARNINPDEAVAWGAAIQASILAGEATEETQDIILVDVTPLSLGIETQGQRMATLIPRGTMTPCEKKDIFTTAADNQTSVEIRVFEGERPLTKHNNLIGSFFLNDIPPAPRGTPKIEITYKVDANGIMSVVAEEKGTGKTNQITITNDTGRLSKEQIDNMVAEAEANAEADRKVADQIEAKNKLETYIFGVRNSLTGELKDKIPEDSVKKINELVEETAQWIAGHPNETKEVYEEKQKELEGQFMPILQAAYAAMGGQPGAQGQAGFPGGFPGGAGFPGAGATGPSASSEPVIEDVDD